MALVALLGPSELVLIRTTTPDCRHRQNLGAPKPGVTVLGEKGNLAADKVDAHHVIDHSRLVRIEQLRHGLVIASTLGDATRNEGDPKNLGHGLPLICRSVPASALRVGIELDVTLGSVG